MLIWLVVGFGIMFAANFALIYYALSDPAWRRGREFLRREPDLQQQDRRGPRAGSARLDRQRDDKAGEWRRARGRRFPRSRRRARARASKSPPASFIRSITAPTAKPGSSAMAAITRVLRRACRAGKWTLDIEAKVAGTRKFFSENKLVLSDNSE